MVIVSFSDPIGLNFRKSAGISNLTVEAGRNYVFSQTQINRLKLQKEVDAKVFRTSGIDYRIVPFRADVEKPGKRVLVYNGSGGYGDQILTWPFTKILADMGFEVHVLIDPGNQTCWWYLPWIKAVVTLPCQYELFKMFDYYALFETLVNVDEHPDQLHPLDAMLTRVGIDPKSIDPSRKVVRPFFTPNELRALNQYPNQDFAMFQLSAANKTRSLTPGDSAYILAKLAEAFPDWLWLACSDEFVDENYRLLISCPDCKGVGQVDDPNSTEKPAPKVPCNRCKDKKYKTIRQNICLHQSPNLRELWALTQKAKVVVAPDSMMVHVAGTMEVPCVGLWGITDPKNRIGYYKKHQAVWIKDACQYAPCHGYAATFPKYCPPRPARQICECMGAISASDVIDAIKQVTAA